MRALQNESKLLNLTSAIPTLIGIDEASSTGYETLWPTSLRLVTEKRALAPAGAAVGTTLCDKMAVKKL